jgi:N,N'-diacetylchitobiose transport system permease protein
MAGVQRFRFGEERAAVSMTLTRTSGDVQRQTPLAGPGRVRRRRRSERFLPYLLALPAVALVIGLLGYPLYRMIVVSLQQYERPQLWGLRPASWVGLGNYTHLLTDRVFWAVVQHTAVFTVVSVAISVVLGMAVALLMGRVSRWARYLMTSALMLVWAMPQLVSSQVFIWMIDADFGVVNWLIDQLPGVNFFKHSWFADPAQGWTVITALVVWQGLPFLAITMHAGLSQVPKDLVEAATVDGAGAWRVFASVRLPIVRPLLGIVTTLSVIWNFQLFTQVWTLRFGKPEPSYQTLSTYAYTQAFESGRYGLGAAVSIITVILMLGVTAFYIRQMFRVGEAEA